MKSLINNAIKNKEVLFLKYQDIKKEYTERSVEPIYIHEIEEEGVKNIILEAFCRLRQSRRNFRLDRVIEINKTNNYFYTDYSPTNTANIFDEISSYSTSYTKRSYRREKVKSGCLGAVFFLLITSIASLYFISNSIIYALLNN